MIKKINNFLSQLSRFDDDFDGEVVYKEHINPFTVIYLRLFSNIKVKKDRRLKTFGRIKGNIFSYVTFPMIFVFGMIIWAVIAAFSNLLPYYETNIFLNGLIISFMIYGILKTFHNSYMLYKTACFFRLIEDVSRKDVVEKQDIAKLRQSLEKDGVLVNTVVMVETIDNVEKFGHPNFNDHRARLIKSKMGFRVSKAQGNVSYIAGILVMLGLLGTFLGLLATIDSVGAALAGMSNIGGEGGVDVEDMSTFISSLAEPLEGMGLAFSSSLFGLSGSLLIGFFIYLSGTPQNSFMENISRWIDDRIPTHNPAQLKMVKDAEKAQNADQKKDDIDAKKHEATEKINPPVKDQDLKDWLSGYVYMSVKMNNLIKDLCAEISSSTQEIQKVTQDNDIIRQTQSDLTAAMTSNNALLQNIEGHNQNMSQAVPTILANSQSAAAHMEELQTNQITGNNILAKMNNQMAQMSEALQINESISQKLSHNAKLISDLIENTHQQSVDAGQRSQQTLELLNAIRVISENAQSHKDQLLELQKQTLSEAQHNAQATQQASVHSAGVMQESLGQISAQLDMLGNKIKHEETIGNIKAIENFVVELNATQKDLVQAMQILSKEIGADNSIKRGNESLMKKIEIKISQLEEILKKLIKK